MEFDVKQFMKATGAKVLQEGAREQCLGLSTDSRTLNPGELFFALKGPHFDGHEFCETAIQKGAWGIVVSREAYLVKRQDQQHASRFTNDASRNTWVFQVGDTLQSLGDLAKWWRLQCPALCVAITGSNGKTTTKEMIASIAKIKWNVLKTEGNFNNLIGLPLTLQNLNKKHQIAILEMGMNAAGEIARLTEIASPTVGAVTNAAAAHLEKLHTVEEVARAKAELYEGMSPDATAVYNAEDPWLSKLVQKFKGKKISFGMRPSDVRFEHMESIGFDSMELKLSLQGKLLQAKLKTAGIHNVMNAMAASAIALSLGISLEAIREGLENFTPLKMRFEQIQLANGVRLVNDAYNANPFSMEAAFRTVGVAKRAGRFIAVLGDMKELGEKSDLLHEEVGKKAVEHGVQRLFLLGEFAEKLAKGASYAGLVSTAITIADDKMSLIQSLSKELQAGDVVLVKGSRAMSLETVVDALKERFGI